MNFVLGGLSGRECPNSFGAGGGVPQLMDLTDDEVEKAIEYFQIPQRMRKNYKVIPKEKNFKSSMWTNGVVLQAKGTDEFSWMCLRSKTCQEKGVSILLGKNKSSSNAVKHLRDFHKIESERSRTMSATKKTRQVQLDDFAQVRNTICPSIQVHRD